MIRLFTVLRGQWRAVTFALAVLTAIGITAGLRLPAAILPEVTFPRITVIADSGERPGEEMLRAVTRPLEESIRRVPGIHEMRSTTSRGSAEINLDCTWKTNMDLALQRVQAQIDAVRATLPPGTAVDARLMNPTLFPVVGFSLTSQRRGLAELRDLAVMVIRPELGRLPGVADVVIQGGRRLEARVTLDPIALQARGLDAAGVAEVLRRSSELESVGLLEANRELYLGLADARPPDLSALGAIRIPVANGPPVPLRELGRVALEEAPEFVRYAAQSREAVLVNVMRQSSASAIGVVEEARRWFAEHRHELPADLRLETFYDQSDLVRDAVGSVRDSLLIGALLAIAVIALFLGSLRLGLAGAVVLPGSIGLTLLGLALTHQSLNLMTLGGIAAAVGLVLDDAIVVVEHLSHRVEHGGDPSDLPGAMAEIFPSLLGSSLCTVAIFLPFMWLSGVTGAFFRVLALSMTLMLTASLLLCVTLIPLLSRPRGVARPSRLEGGFIPRHARFGARHAWVGLVAVGVFVAALVPLKATLGSGFLPEMDEGALILDFVMPPGTSVTEGDRILRGIEREIGATAAIAAWSRRMGDQLGFFITEPNTGDYVLRLMRGRRPSAEAVADGLRRRIEASYPAVDVEFGQLVEDVIGDLTTNPQPIEIRLFDEDRPLAQVKAREVARIIAREPGVVDVRDGVVVSGPNLSIRPRPSASWIAWSAADLSNAVAPAVGGLAAGEIVRGAHVWPVRVVLPPPTESAGPASLGTLRVPVAAGRWVPLDQVAALDIEAGETEIARDNQRSMVSVTARLSGRDLGSAMAGIRARLGREFVRPPGMGVQYAGLWAEQQDSFRGLSTVLVGAAAAVMMILLFSFRSWRQTGAVALVVLASLAGVFAALQVGRATFNISSFVGAIMVVGIVAENAYFLVAAHRAGLAAGASPVQAAQQAAIRRARPVLMTTAAGIAALAPLALGLSAGSELLRPLAIAVVGGFLVSGLLLLVALPSLLAAAGGGVN